MRILLRFKDGDVICPYSPTFESIDRLLNITSPFDHCQEKRNVVKTVLHGLNKQNRRVIVFKEESA